MRAGKQSVGSHYCALLCIDAKVLAAAVGANKGVLMSCSPAVSLLLLHVLLFNWSQSRAAVLAACMLAHMKLWPATAAAEHRLHLPLGCLPSRIAVLQHA